MKQVLDSKQAAELKNIGISFDIVESGEAMRTPTIGELFEWLIYNTNWNYQDICSRMCVRSAWQSDEWEDELIDELFNLCIVVGKTINRLTKI